MKWQDVISELKSKPFVFDSMTEMDKLKIQEHLAYYDSFQKVFKKDISRQLLSDLNNRVNGVLDNNANIFMYGSKGSMKSAISQEIAKLYYPDMNVSNIVFTNYDLKNAIAESGTGEWYIRDETIMDYGVGSKQMESDINMFCETLRKTRNSLIFICPTQKSIKAVDYIFHTFSGNFCNKHKQAMFGVIDPYGSRRYMGAGRMPLEWKGKLWNDYCKIKDEFLEMVRNTDVQVYNIMEMAEKVMAEHGFKNCKTLKEIEVFVKEFYPHLVTQMQKDIATKIKMLKRSSQA